MNKIILTIIMMSLLGGTVSAMKRVREEPVDDASSVKAHKFSQAKLNERFLEFCKDGGLMWMNNYFLNGAHVNECDDKLHTCLHYACLNGIYCHVEQLIAKGALVELQTEDGFTPLHFAAHNGHAGICELLVKNKASLEARTKDGFTPLHIAVIFAKRDAIALLLKYGAELYAKTNDGRTVLGLAKQSGRDDMVVYLEYYLKQKPQENGACEELTTPLE